MSVANSSGVPDVIVVGIAGGSASGKSTFTEELRRVIASRQPEIAVQVVGMDRYFYRGRSPGPIFVSPSSGESLPHNNHPDSADNVLLAADLDAIRAAGDRPQIVLVEGLMALHVDIVRERLDLKIFVELEADIRALRRLLRDSNGARGNADPAWIATYYRECARVGHETWVEPSRVHADLIIRGDSDFERTAPFVVDVILAQF